MDDERKNLVEMKNCQGDNVIMDLNPKNFEKQKDHLFFDFFSLYAKNIIQNKSQDSGVV